jgi:hypothetical protein
MEAPVAEVSSSRTVYGFQARTQAGSGLTLWSPASLEPTVDSMNAPSSRGSWIAVSWAMGLNLVGVVTAVSALLSGFSLFGDSEPMTGGAKVALALGLVVLAAAPVLAAWSSGQPLWFLVGIGGGLAAVGGFWVGVQLFGDLGAALVLGLAAEAAVAVRPPVSGAVVARGVAVSLLALVCTMTAGTESFLVLPFLAQPAIALADTLVSGAAESSATPLPRPPSP